MSKHGRDEEMAVKFVGFSCLFLFRFSFSIPVFRMMPNLINPIVAYQRVRCDHILNLTFKEDFSSVNSIDLEIMFRILNLVNSRCDSEVSTSNNTNNMINFLFLYIRYLFSNNKLSLFFSSLLS
uniref:Uncharacterized protein n=1 Tax=Cacopsylla melanoneura TaxID=428564 RepID=A0A8D8ZBE9_9HEMI